MTLKVKTPTEWQHVRIVETDDDEYALRTYYTFSSFGPIALAALGIAPATETQGLTAAQALALGETIEAAMVKVNQLGRGRRSKD